VVKRGSSFGETSLTTTQQVKAQQTILAQEVMKIVNNCMAKAIKKQALGRVIPMKDPENDIKSVDDKNADKVVGNIIELEIEAIEINPFQPQQL
jgi:hypothetical protein